MSRVFPSPLDLLLCTQVLIEGMRVDIGDREHLALKEKSA